MRKREAPRAISAKNPSRKVRYRVIAHQEGVQPNPTGGQALQLTPYEPPEHLTEREVARALSRLPDHLLVEFPGLLSVLPAWLAARAGTDIDLAELRDVLVDQVGFSRTKGPSPLEVVDQMVQVGVLVESPTQEVARLRTLEAGTQPPTTGMMPAIKWALRQVSVGAKHAPAIQELLTAANKQAWKEYKLRYIDLGYVREVLGNYFEAVEDESFKPDMHQLVDALIKARVLLGVSKDYYSDSVFDPKIAGKGWDVIVPYFEQRWAKARAKYDLSRSRNQLPSKGFDEVFDELQWLQDVTPRIRELAGAKPPPVRKQRKPAARKSSTGKVAPLHIEDYDRVLEVLAGFEGDHWRRVQQYERLHPGSVRANSDAWVVIQELGAVGRSITIPEILEGGGAIDGDPTFGRKYVVQKDGKVALCTKSVKDDFVKRNRDLLELAGVGITNCGKRQTKATAGK